MHPPGSSDALRHWLDRLRLGDPTARNELIGHSQDCLRQLTRRMLRRFPAVREWEQTSDVFQNVLVRLARSLATATPATPEDLLRLAASLIRRELIDLNRHLAGPRGVATHRLPPGHPTNGQLPDPADSSHDPDGLERWGHLHAAIAALPEEQRRLFDLIYYQGLEVAEVANLLGVEPRALRAAWQQARLRFLDRFGDELPF